MPRRLSIKKRKETRKEILKLRGQVKWEADLDDLRGSRHPNDRDFDAIVRNKGLKVYHPK